MTLLKNQLSVCTTGKSLQDKELHTFPGKGDETVTLANNRSQAVHSQDVVALGTRDPL